MLVPPTPDEGYNVEHLIVLEIELLTKFFYRFRLFRTFVTFFGLSQMYHCEVFYILVLMYIPELNICFYF